MTLGVRLAQAVLAFQVLGAPAGASTQAPGASPPGPRVEAGRIEGRATVASPLTSRKMRFRPYADYGEGQFPAESAGRGSELANVVLYLEAVDGVAPSTPTTHSVVQEDEVFRPHVLAVRRGDRVEFPNADNIYHNVFSLSGPATFDLGRYPRGDSRGVVLEEPGVVRVFCQIHSDMSAIVLVLDNPFYAVPAADGDFAIDDVPPGEYTLVAWHERIRPLRRQVVVRPGEVTSLRIHLPDLSDGSQASNGR